MSSNKVIFIFTLYFTKAFCHISWQPYFLDCASRCSKKYLCNNFSMVLRFFMKFRSILYGGRKLKISMLHWAHNRIELVAKLVRVITSKIKFSYLQCMWTILAEYISYHLLKQKICIFANSSSTCSGCLGLTWGLGV